MYTSTNKLFIAMPAPPVIAGARKELIQLNSAHTGIKWVPEENLHITVFFLGFVEVGHIPVIKQVMTDCLLNIPAFTLHMTGITLEGGRRDHPSMIWARFERDVHFSKLARKLGEKLVPYLSAPAKFPDPIPHITIARIKHNPAPNISVAITCEARFEGYELWRSISIEGGVKYEKL